jgi:PGF-CTERM protein
MSKRLTITLVALAIFVLLAVLPVSAATANATRIATGAQVLVGESGLNLLALSTDGLGANLNTLAWFPSTAQTSAKVPEKTIDITATRAAFFVSPADFATRTGNWYCWTNGMEVGTAPIAFIAADPSMDVKIWDIDQDKDVTGKSVPMGQRLVFRIDTNTYPIANNAMRPWILQPGWFGYSNLSFYGFDVYTGATETQTKEGFVDIKVKTDQGNTLSALYNGSTDTAANRATTKPIPLTGLWVNNQPWYWGNFTNNTGAARAVVGSGVPQNSLNYINYSLFWDTGSIDAIGQKVYPAGTYTVTAELTLNAIKDNYKNAGADYAGKTITEARTITLVSDTVKIEANKDTVTRSKPFSVTVTGKPSTFYWVWVKGVSQMTGMYDNQPPLIPPYQSGVYNDTPTFPVAFVGKYFGDKFVPQNTLKTVDQFAAGYNNPVGAVAGPPTGGYPFNGTGYYVMIKTTESGTRTVEFVTSNQTKAQKYTIRVENQTPGVNDYKTDEVDVKVEKGAVTVTAAGDGSYYLGEEIKFSGTNTETSKTYLFITGPNLQSVGSQINVPNPRTLPVANNQPATFKVVDVASDNSWSWKWGTATVALDAGTYTVYAVSSPNDKDTLANTAYGTVSIIIKKPFVSATVSSSTVASGDTLYVRGIAEGKPSPGVQMWVLGKNYPTTIADIKTASVNSDATFEFEIKDTTTKNLAAGQYFVVVQHPMQNDVFDIVALTIGANVVVQNQQLGAGTPIFTLLGQGSLQGSDAAEALVQAINDPNVDDTYTKLQFLIEEPVIRIDPIGDKHVGDKFTIRAQTNLAVDDEVLFEVYSSSFKPTQKTQSGEFSGATGTVKVTKGLTGMNALAFDVNAATFKPDEYIVTATAIIQGTTGTALFNVLEGAAPTAAPTVVVVVVAPTTAPTAPPTAVATPTKTPTQPGFGALVALIGLGAVAFLVVRKH